MPNAKEDWINQRDRLFDTLILIGDKNSKVKNTIFEPNYARGIGTSRDAWAYNFSKKEMLNSMRKSNDFFNAQRIAFQEEIKINTDLKVEDFISNNLTKISWSRAYRNDIKLNKEHFFDETKTRIGLHRPFSKETIYFDKKILNDVGPIFNMFPTPKHENLVIVVQGTGGKENMPLITNCIPDLHLNGDSQCFPLYYYTEQKTENAGTLFDGVDGSEKYIRKDGVTDWILEELKARYGASSKSRTITKEHIFYYVYGLLHSKDYRARFRDDLKKSLPRLPIVESFDDFLAFYNAGKKLAELHLNYESIEPMDGVVVTGDEMPKQVRHDTEEYAFYAVQGKMSYAKKRDENGKSVADKTQILYNSNIRISNIPQKAYEYIVNGKSALDWIMERYCVSTDKESGITNNANDWAAEHGKPRYILDLILSVINVSCQTVDIVNALPRLDFAEKRESLQYEIPSGYGDLLVADSGGKNN